MNTPDWLKACTEARTQAINAMTTLAQLIQETEPTPRAKILTARVIASLARTAQITTRLRQELAHPGAKP